MNDHVRAAAVREEEHRAQAIRRLQESIETLRRASESIKTPAAAARLCTHIATRAGTVLRPAEGRGGLDAWTHATVMAEGVTAPNILDYLSAVHAQAVQIDTAAEAVRDAIGYLAVEA